MVWVGLKSCTFSRSFNSLPRILVEFSPHPHRPDRSGQLKPDLEESNRWSMCSDGINLHQLVDILKPKCALPCSNIACFWIVEQLYALVSFLRWSWGCCSCSPILSRSSPIKTIKNGPWGLLRESQYSQAFLAVANDFSGRFALHAALPSTITPWSLALHSTAWPPSKVSSKHASSKRWKISHLGQSSVSLCSDPSENSASRKDKSLWYM